MTTTRPIPAANDITLSRGLARRLRRETETVTTVEGICPLGMSFTKWFRRQVAYVRHQHQHRVIYEEFQRDGKWSQWNALVIGPFDGGATQVCGVRVQARPGHPLDIVEHTLMVITKHALERFVQRSGDVPDWSSFAPIIEVCCSEVMAYTTDELHLTVDGRVECRFVWDQDLRVYVMVTAV